MEYSSENYYKTIDLVRKLIPFKVVIKSINRDEVLLRSDIKDMTEAAMFVDAYGAVINARFTLPTPGVLLKRPGCRRRWICQHRTVKCSAKVYVLIKKVNKQNKIKDAFLRRNPPFLAVIIIKSSHNHPLVTLSSSTKTLKINDGVKECFYEYFKRGFYGPQAKYLHESNLRKQKFFALDDTSMNPSIPAINSLYSHWVKILQEKETIPKNLGFVEASKVHMPMLGVNNVRPPLSKSNFINVRNVASKCDSECHKSVSSENTASDVVEDVKPILNIKQEVEDDYEFQGVEVNHVFKKEMEDNDDDDNTGLPVILSYGSVAEAVSEPSPPPPPQPPSTAALGAAVQNVATVVKVIAPHAQQLVVYDQSSNTYKVVKCLSVNPASGAYLSTQHNAYLSSTILTNRVSLQK